MAKTGASNAKRSRAADEAGPSSSFRPAQHYPPRSSTNATRPRDASPNSSSQSEEEEEEEAVFSRTSLSLSAHPLPALTAIVDTLSQFTKLHKLDLSSLQPSEANPNGLTTLDWIGKAVRKSRKQAQKLNTDDPSWFGRHLTTLNLSANKSLTDDGLVGLEGLTRLVVLNLSHCGLTTLPPTLTPLKSLKVLVLHYNALTSLPASFPYLPELNTLILSHNRLTSLPATLPAAVPALRKLALSHNDLGAPSSTSSASASSLPDFSTCLSLREVRLTGNTQLGRLPSHLLRWGKGADGHTAPGLEVLDVGDCGLSDWTSVSALLADPTTDKPARRRKGLANLSLRGNPLTQLPDYRERLLRAHPKLKVLDTDRLVAKVPPVSRKEKRAEARRGEPTGRTRDSGYAQVRARRDGEADGAPRSPARSDDDEDDEAAAQMAEEMRRARRQLDTERPDATVDGEDDGRTSSHPSDRPKAKHKRAGSRTHTRKAHPPVDPPRPTVPAASSFFEPVASAPARQETKRTDEGVREDATPAGQPAASTRTPRQSGNKVRAKRSGKKVRELDMGDNDDEGGGDTSAGLDPAKRGQGRAARKERPDRTAWDHASPVLTEGKREGPSAEKKDTPPQMGERERSSVAAVVDLRGRDGGGRKAKRKAAVEGERGAKRSRTVPFSATVAAVGQGGEVGAGAGGAWT